MTIKWPRQLEFVSCSSFADSQMTPANENVKHLSSLSLSSLPFDDVGDDTGKHLQTLWKLQGHCCKEKKKSKQKSYTFAAEGLATCYLINSQRAQPYIAPQLLGQSTPLTANSDISGQFSPTATLVLLVYFSEWRAVGNIVQPNHHRSISTAHGLYRAIKPSLFAASVSLPPAPWVTLIPSLCYWNATFPQLYTALRVKAGLHYRLTDDAAVKLKLSSQLTKHWCHW